MHNSDHIADDLYIHAATAGQAEGGREGGREAGGGPRRCSVTTRGMETSRRTLTLMKPPLSNRLWAVFNARVSLLEKINIKSINVCLYVIVIHGEIRCACRDINRPCAVINRCSACSRWVAGFSTLAVSQSHFTYKWIVPNKVPFVRNYWAMKRSELADRQLEGHCLACATVWVPLIYIFKPL